MDECLRIVLDRCLVVYGQQILDIRLEIYLFGLEERSELVHSCEVYEVEEEREASVESG
jgi:hypothetical protein